MLSTQVSLARAPGDYFTVLLCFWGALSIMPFATVRAFANPAVALPNGEVSVHCLLQLALTDIALTKATSLAQACAQCTEKGCIHDGVLKPGVA